MSNKFTDFNIDPGAYVAFDATSLRDLIIGRLNKQATFTDQVYEGSNLSSIIDIISYSYHTLMFYLNKTSSEAMFSDSQLYENMNRIVKLLNYKPTGYQTSVLSFTGEISSNLDIGTYAIPRYTLVDVAGIPFSFRNDIIFTKPTASELSLSADHDQFLLHQGEYIEHPSITAIGETFEKIVLSLMSTEVLIDHFCIDVYVKESSGEYFQYTETSSLYLELPDARKFEKRLNENLRYEFRFGNGVNGRKLEEGDEVKIYYLSSLGDAVVVGASALKDKPITLYTTPQYNSIASDTRNDNINYLNFDGIKNLSLSNSLPSTEPQPHEDTASIRDHAPHHFLSQERLITAADFTLFVSRNFGNIITDVKAVNNDTYINGHLQYLYDEIGLEQPTLESRVLFNQANFSTSTNFNNVYLYCIPRTSRKSSLNIQTNFLPVSQKEAIRNRIETSKSLTIDPVFADPVYMAVDICVDSNSPDVSSETYLEITKSKNLIRNSDSIKQDVHDTIIAYFNVNNCKLGQMIDIDQLVSDILSIDGIATLRTKRSTNPPAGAPGGSANTSINGLGLLIWNPVYESKDANVYNQNVQLPYYKFPYFFDELTLLSRIAVIEST